MRIGVDAYYLSSSQIDGLGNYLLRLLKALSAIDTENEYILYTPGIVQRLYADAIRRNSRFSIAVIPGIFPRSRRLWLQSPSLIRRAVRDRIDLFFAGAEYFPLLLPCSIRVAVTIHDVAFKAMPEAISIPNMIFYRFFFPLLVRRADFFFTVSHHSKREMVDYLGIAENAIRVVYNGIELDHFPAGSDRDKQDYILFVGTLQPRKNLANLIKAYALIASRVTADLVIVGGSGWKNHSVRTLIEGLEPQVRKRITFCGYVTGDELPALYRRAKLFVLPSLHEGFCLPILEAMASGTAVITARSAAIPEVFGDAAAYADPLSPENIGRRIEELLTNHTLRASFVRKGRILSKRFSVERQAAGYLEAFRAIQRGEFKGKGGAMKIAINARVLNERHGGPARYTLNLIRELTAIDRDNSYEILMYDRKDFPFTLPENVTVRVVPIRSKIFFDYLYLPIYSWRHRPDIFLFPKNTYSPLVRGKKIPVYHDIVYFEKLTFREFKFFDNLHHRLMIPVAARFSWIDLTVSEFTASRMRELLGIRPEKIRVVKEGVESHFARISDKERLAATEKKLGLIRPFFFYAGSLSPRKNMLNLIKAFARIKHECPHRIYVTGGDSWRDTEVFHAIESEGLSNRVIRLGYIDEEDLVAMYNMAEAYLYPSLYEGFGLPILEAQACGCPVITSNRSSCPEVAGDGALYVDPYDIDDMAEAMLRIIRDEHLRKRLIEAGFANCARYSWRATAEGVLAIFQSADSQKNASAAHTE